MRLGPMIKKLVRPLLLVTVLVVAAGAVAIAVMPRSQQQQQGQRPAGGRPGAPADRPVPVLAAAASIADVPVYLNGVGTIKALNTVTVRPQVDGKLIKISFKEGQDVERGYVLAEIDPTTYQAQLDQAVALKAQHQAQLANARMDVDRYTQLAKLNAGSQQQADAARAQAAQLEAQIKADEAAIENARAILGYTKVVAPISGRTGIRQIDEGNIVHASDATGIVVITQIRPISVLFNLPQQNLAEVNKAFAKEPLRVEALAADGRTVADRGILQVVDNQVDQTTGTVRLKAEFPNADLQLWPGQFVGVRLLTATLKQVVVVPAAAVQRGPNGPYVFVIQPDSTIAMRPVTITQQDERRAVIATGLDAQEQVVTSGFARLANGTRVAISQPAGDTARPPAGNPPDGARPPGARAGGGGEGRHKAGKSEGKPDAKP
ncbi:efflux RND transporter periplasmic adaptor subunit [Vineibacter terrae]|uniref:Efflux RND transporter periplasmic adaptor subunit n=1 Tax=Vineibacter terrae TaxID=2586908 RepID=A0A5C8PMM0_9HYPH|nr:efflux RND transporter periplasmic adaptor subunit [Vineibacter terrae]TXL75188.1 efflux RND transporter periplasmic adaptor subunit [Vineibacter terrae]